MSPTKEKISGATLRAEDREKTPEDSAGESKIRAMVVALPAVLSMLVAILGGACMGGAAVAVSSGESLGLIPLYLSVAVTALVVCLSHLSGGMILASVCAAFSGLSVVLGPALMQLY